MNKQTNNQESKLGVYELGYLLDPKLTDDQAAKKATDLGAMMSQEAGEVIASGEPKMRSLAYQMTIKTEGKRRDYEKAYFGWVKFTQSPAAIAELEKKVKSDTQVVRYLLIKTVREDTMAHVTDEEVSGEDQDDIVELDANLDSIDDIDSDESDVEGEEVKES